MQSSGLADSEGDGVAVGTADGTTDLLLESEVGNSTECITQLLAYLVAT